MDYDEFTPDWDAVDLPQRAALDARLQDMLIQHLDNDPMWPNTVTALADDLVTNDEVRKALTRFCILVENMAVWQAGGRQEAIDDMCQTLVQLRAIAAGPIE
jgi:thioredoxin-like negative regulator of GroEL